VIESEDELAPVRARAVFFDKDGTLVENLPYNADPSRIALTAHAAEAIGALAAAGYRLIVVSNQPGVALGYFGAGDLYAVEARLRELLPSLNAFYYCPHKPAAGCKCRKPASGLLLRAAREHGVRLDRSWMVGDILDDIEAGRRAGCRTVLVDNGNETEWQLSEPRRPHRVVGDLFQAAAHILEAA
jgi:D-glycero-D-manno-heptose 1,7-bisphosphate phosphatase